ncbi:methyl-accepting chemotaxis protein [Pseudomonas cichorii]|uniref:Methyl-accepting chemotaxis protein n=3 Tax=Pseudomonas TaxID=286 RepID=A0ABX8HS77_9PSED|nr:MULTISPECIES: methyl-accepting chemotaxis protein [Pseudomonas syringae group]MBX8488936.1 methyl-accepting chemotaxis protein [Pseudomonas cichorii]MBX8501096.1 methyl-accepting chemotaxis protein [Pseudomonas lijiangensis]MBX8505930.1 methyl-accepting chemotaxis protein [Pseudomonas lijiangensis]MBX8520682.1 methyl-accepting chemotaxis protein [Pseudomonas cichorii]MBX8573778.1 methyl-accepting chemotaxis protein [Pseudomonas cichorii]
MLNNILINMTVRSKLVLGFTLVIIFTVLIALTGWRGISSLSERSERVSDIAKLTTLTRDMRIARLVYAQNSDDANAATWLKAYDNLDSHLAYLRQILDSEINIPHVKSATAAMTVYKGFYNDVINATHARETSRAVLGSNSDDASEALQRLDALAYSPEGTPAQQDAIRQAQALFQKMRFDVRGYTYTLKPDAQPLAIASIAAVVNNTQSLQAAGFQPDAIKGLQAPLSKYQAAIAQFSEAQIAINQGQAGITKTIEVLLSSADQLAQNQVSLRIEDVGQANKMLIIWLSIALIISALAAWVITRLIVGPLREALQLADRVANGDLTYSEVTVRRDELGLLQTSMHRMTTNLRQLIGGLRDSVTQIASAAEQLSAVTEQTSAGVNSQRTETDQVATAMNEMAATVQEVARNAEQASDAAVSASKEARDGDAVVAKAVLQIEKLATEVGHSKTAMDELKQESNKIGGVLDVIKAVAEQTNLLALNAAIEAARAGEAGRGFAVVADEVRSLAQRTQESTEEIATLIGGLHSRTAQVATTLENSRLLTDNSVELARDAGASIGNISRSISTIESMNQQIAASAEEQSAVAEEINRSVLSVRDISEQTASASEQTAASSVELARLGVHLQGLVSKFVV